MTASLDATPTAKVGPVAKAEARSAATRWAAPVALFAVALLVRLGGLAMVRFPLTEGSAYYTAVAENLATGRGLVVDAIWSYATPPLALPRAAFELWQPLASFLAAAPMPFLGAGFESAQLAFALVGALLAPLTWYVARDAAQRLGTPDRRASILSIGAGFLAAMAGPLVLATAVPDSALPFTVLAVAACTAMPGALGGDRRALLVLGVLAGLTYLTRMEAVYLAAAFLLVGLGTGIGWRLIVGRGAIVAGVAALIALPWWLRNLATFGTPLPGQLADNAFLIRNEQIFGYSDRPTLAGFLDQGTVTIVLNIIEAFRHDLLDVMLVPSIAIVAVALAAMVVGRRRAVELRASALAALLILGSLTLLVTSVVFPVATLWGTFEHASGPLLVALIVCAALGADAFVARVREWRGWPRSNAWLAPAALIALTVPLTVLQLTGAAHQARQEDRRFTALGSALPAALSGAGVEPGSPVVTDRPLWLSDALAGPAIALPDEPTPDVIRLAREFGSTAVIVVEERGRYPAALASDACFTEVATGSGDAEARLFVLAEACR